MGFLRPSTDFSEALEALRLNQQAIGVPVEKQKALA